MMKIRTWYKLHKWTAIITGLALVMWLLTGITMSWEHVFSPTEHEATAVNYSEAVLSPADAVTAVITLEESDPTIKQIQLKQLLDDVVYEVELANGKTYLIGAKSGQPVKITADLAMQIAQDEVAQEMAMSQITLLTQHSASYPYGYIPVFEVAFANKDRVYVSVTSGDTQITSQWDRLRVLINSLHTFDTLRIAINRGKVITLLLIMVTLSTIVMALMGYYLALPGRWQILNRKRK
ncbi:MAG: hypothetical protein GY796_08770 [Chloroflexi bacterium]|nr:hypothetical protein [Chloroflexota bacterium]